MIDVVDLDRADLDAAAALLDRLWPGGATVAAEKLFEIGSATPRALGVWRGGELAGLAVIAGPYLRVLGVAPEHRGLGIGSALLAAAGDGELVAAAEPGNYLTPGVDAADQATLGWLERRGFERRGEAVNAIIDLTDNPALALDDRASELGIGRAGPGDAAELDALITRDHPAAWAVEVARALRPPSGVFVARDRSGAIVGFAARDGNNRGLGGFGPAAIEPRYRGRGVGAALLRAALADVAATGHARCTVGWIGPRAFYQRVVGIAAEQRFVKMRRSRQP